MVSGLKLGGYTMHRRQFITSWLAVSRALGGAGLFGSWNPAFSAPNLGSMATSADIQGGSNPPWFPSLMAFEHYDSGRTKLFEQAHFTGSFVRDNTAVDVRLSPGEYPTPYNVVYLSGASLFIFGGAYGDKGGTRSVVGRVNPQTLQTLGSNPFDNSVDTLRWELPGGPR